MFNIDRKTLRFYATIFLVIIILFFHIKLDLREQQTFFHKAKNTISNLFRSSNTYSTASLLEYEPIGTPVNKTLSDARYISRIHIDYVEYENLTTKLHGSINTKQFNNEVKLNTHQTIINSDTKIEKNPIQKKKTGKLKSSTIIHYPEGFWEKQKNNNYLSNNYLTTFKPSRQSVVTVGDKNKPGRR